MSKLPPTILYQSIFVVSDYLRRYNNSHNKKTSSYQHPLQLHFTVDSFGKETITMRLNMALNGILVGSATLDPSRCKDEFYLQAMRRLLVLQNQEILQMIPAKPVYYIEVSSSMPSLSFAQANTKGIEHAAI